jgi:hypothetical protein
MGHFWSFRSSSLQLLPKCLVEIESWNEIGLRRRTVWFPNVHPLVSTGPIYEFAFNCVPSSYCTPTVFNRFRSYIQCSFYLLNNRG